MIIGESVIFAGFDFFPIPLRFFPFFSPDWKRDRDVTTFIESAEFKVDENEFIKLFNRVADSSTK